MGVALNAVLVGVPLSVMERHFHGDGRPKHTRSSRGHACLLAEAIDDIRAAAVEECGVPPEVVESWGPIGVDDALAAAERLGDRARARRDDGEGA